MGKLFSCLIHITIIWYFLLFIIPCSWSQSRPFATNLGEVSLKNWDFEKQGKAVLSGPWAFYWSDFLHAQPSDSALLPSPTCYVKIPSIWNDYRPNGQDLPGKGFGSYRLTIWLDSAHKNQELALQVGRIASAYTIFQNGAKIHEVGKPSPDFAKTIPTYYEKVIRLHPVPSGKLELVIWVSNASHWKGGITDPIRLGTLKQLHQNALLKYTLYVCMIGSFLFMVFYHFILYFFRKKEKYPLFFAIFCTVLIIRVFATEEYLLAPFVDIPWHWLIRADYITYYWSIAVFGSFSEAVLHGLLHKKILKTIWYTTLIFTAFYLILPVEMITKSLPVNQAFGIISATYGLIRMYIFAVRKIAYARTFLFGFIFLFGSLIHDIIATQIILPWGDIFSRGLFIFMFIQTAIIAKKFSKTFDVLEDTYTQLEDTHSAFKEVHAELEINHEKIEEKNALLEKLNQELDSLVYRISHDLRAPITSVLGLINIMRIQPDEEQRAYYLQLQEKSLLKLDQFIKDLLDYSRNTRTEIAKELVDFHEMIEEVFTLHVVNKGNVQVHKKTNIEQLEQFVSDKRRIGIILNNLVSNAMRYHDPHKPESYVQIDIKTNKELATIRIIDNGLGIAPEHHQKIFDMFYRAHPEIYGSGLGLYIVKESVEKLKGKVEVESKPKEGTVFILTIPNLSNH